MKIKNIFFIFFLLFSASAFATLSAVRLPHENFQEARTRHILRNILDVVPLQQNQSAWDVADSFERMNYSEVTDLKTIEKLNQIFTFVRDSKFMQNQPAPLTKRRLSWLYPDDGCYIRAELATYFLNKKLMTETYKFFSFGDLAVRSNNHPDGIVRWWYHVVPLYRVGQQAYVLDPSIDSRRPMTVEEWKKAQESERPVVKFAVCKPHALGPEDNCQRPYGMAYEVLENSQEAFLQSEWDRLEILGRNPTAELGDAPPWK